MDELGFKHSTKGIKFNTIVVNSRNGIDDVYGVAPHPFNKNGGNPKSTSYVKLKVWIVWNYIMIDLLLRHLKRHN